MVEKLYCALFLLYIFTGGTWGQTEQFTIPDIELFAISPKGLRVEFPDQPGIELFAFHANRNERLNVLEKGGITGQINSPTNGKWVFEDPKIELEIGDKLYYWVYIQHNVIGYTKRDLMWEVTDFSRGGVCASSSTTATGTNKAICSGSIIFEDNFSEPKLNENEWIVQKYIPSITDDDHHEFVSYQDRDENRFIRNSVLYLKPIAAASRTDVFGVLDLTQGCTRIYPQSCKVVQVGAHILPPVVSAKVLSRMSFRYGKIEIKAKMPIGDWIYPQIELIPKNKLPSYPKILIAYTRGNVNLMLNNSEDIGNTVLFGGPVSSPLEPQRSRNLRIYRLATPLGKDVRIYTLTWSPTRIELKVDNDQYGIILGHEYSEFNTEYQISLGVGVGGNYDFPDDVKSGNIQKPWRNFNSKNMKNFFDQKNFWITTWHGDDVALQVESVKVWAV